mmetsp:Transcript_8665/g.14688  ORF Transcript_8665/g.14688 Transcript_8665/m.14688 type:complete len:512 (+) Transcript_8665:279-1814(+)
MPLKVVSSRIIEIPVYLQAPKPYILHNAKDEGEGVAGQGYQAEMRIDFHDISDFFNALRDVYHLFNQHGSQYEDQLDVFIFQHYDFARHVRDAQFDTTRLKKFSEKKMLPQELKIKFIMPLVSVDGLLYLTDERVYMQPLHPQILGKAVLNLKIPNIKQLFKRRYTLMDVGLEITSLSLKPAAGKGARSEERRKKKTFYLVFGSTQERDLAFHQLSQLVGADCVTTQTNLDHYTQKWREGLLTNFDYLMLVNSYAQRSFQDLTQYPVMPWVLKDYKSPVLNLADPNVYRDFSKPIGAMDPKRLQDFRQRYDETPEGADKFLYGSHYSCPGYVIGFHVRSNPQWMIKFQSGKFDNPNRMFKGINKEWNSCNVNPTNVKELIPEFFMENDEHLVNHKKLDLGMRTNGKRVDDVKLPKWASSAEDFLKKHRRALESPHVSANLHKWIDLIFGYKQNSIEDDNVYHPYSYEGYLDLEKVTDVQMRKAYETHVREFGQTPRQLFFKQHPKRLVQVN